MKDNLASTFQTFLKTENLIGKKILLCVSGGVDSMVLFDVARRELSSFGKQNSEEISSGQGLKNLAVFHLDHGLRSDSMKDFALVRSLCQAAGIRFYGERLSEIPTKNQEASWRNIRQNRAKKSAENFGAARILTAHHATDLAETMIFRLVKGAGLNGMAPFDISTKPFWKNPKSEILAYGKEKKLDWNEDTTNQETKHQRNLIRLKILPELRKITPNLEKVCVAEHEIFQKSADFLSSQVDPWFENLSTVVGGNGLKPFHGNLNISVSEFQDLDEVLQWEILRRVSGSTPSFDEMKDCLKWLKGEPKGNSVKEIGGVSLKIFRGKILKL